MAKLRYYTAAAVTQLRNSVEERLDWYYHPRGSPADPVLTASESVKESCLEVSNLADSLTLPDGSPGGADGASALRVYELLSELTPQQASDERLWTYLCHVECPEYVSGRWLQPRPVSDDQAARKVRNHFFAQGNRAVIRDNGVSRLWWLGFIANEVEPDDSGAFLERLLHRQDVRSALIERPSVSMNRQVLRSINGVMREYWERDRTLFEREPFRRWMVGLNRRGGVVLLDVLSEEVLVNLLEEEAKRALSVGSASG